MEVPSDEAELRLARRCDRVREDRVAGVDLRRMNQRLAVKTDRGRKAKMTKNKS
jgi:hypothetical protein